MTFRRLALLDNQHLMILIVFALDESVLFDVIQFPMKNIYQSCDLGRIFGRTNVSASQ